MNVHWGYVPTQQVTKGAPGVLHMGRDGWVGDGYRTPADDVA